MDERLKLFKVELMWIACPEDEQFEYCQYMIAETTSQVQEYYHGDDERRVIDMQIIAQEKPTYKKYDVEDEIIALVPVEHR